MPSKCRSHDHATRRARFRQSTRPLPYSCCPRLEWHAQCGHLVLWRPTHRAREFWSAGLEDEESQSSRHTFFRRYCLSSYKFLFLRKGNVLLSVSTRQNLGVMSDPRCLPLPGRPIAKALQGSPSFSLTLHLWSAPHWPMQSPPTLSYSMASLSWVFCQSQWFHLVP